MSQGPILTPAITSSIMTPKATQSSRHWQSLLSISFQRKVCQTDRVFLLETKMALETGGAPSDRKLQEHLQNKHAPIILTQEEMRNVSWKKNLKGLNVLKRKLQCKAWDKFEYFSVVGMISVIWKGMKVDLNQIYKYLMEDYPCIFIFKSIFLSFSSSIFCFLALSFSFSSLSPLSSSFILSEQ